MAALFRFGFWDKIFLRVLIGKIGVDRSRLKKDEVFVLQGGNLTRGNDGEVLRITAFSLMYIDLFDSVVNLELFEHPKTAKGSSVFASIEGDCHEGTPFTNWVYQRV